MYKFIMEHKEIINLLASVGTFISAIVALYTLGEVKKQRLSTYKPELVLKSFIVYINKSPLLLEPSELLKFKTGIFNEYKDSKTEKDFDVSSLYKVENLGFGLAKNIKLTWTYNMHEALRLLEGEFYNDLYFSQFKPLKSYFLQKRSDENFQISFKNENKLIQTIDYIAPINVKEHTHYHAIPRDIIVSQFLYFILKKKLINKISKNTYVFDFEEFPKAELKVEYNDLNGKKYRNNYKFKTSIVVTQIGDEIDMSKEFGYLLFKLE